MGIGKSRRLSRILKDWKCVLSPLDDSLISGPEGGLRDMGETLNKIITARPDGILGYVGLLLKHHEILQEVPYILNLTASTIRGSHTRKVLIGDVEGAIRYGVDAVAVHVNVGSKYQNEMLKNLAIVSKDCNRFQMPLLALMYPRGEKLDGSDDNYLDLKKNDPEAYTELVADAVRLGYQYGADIIKTQYTGDPETFKTAISLSQGIPVVIAGGSKIGIEDMLSNVEGAMLAGAAGCCTGRNVFNADDPTMVLNYLKAIVHEGIRVEALLPYII